MTELPQVIYLQLYDDGERVDGLPETFEHVTWSVEKINSSDVRYVIDRRHLKKAKESRE